MVNMNQYIKDRKVAEKIKRGDEKEAESILRKIKKESVKILSSCIQI